jgi:hypothetical protein
MTELFLSALKIQRALDAVGTPNCIIGGLAVLRWGKPRPTKDVDIAALAGFGLEAPVVDLVLSTFTARTPDARAFAIRHRTLLARDAGIAIDISLAALPFEERMMQRASAAEYAPGVSLRTASAEDLVTMKVFAGRARDLDDVRGILVRQGDRLDRTLVRRELAELEALAERA